MKLIPRILLVPLFAFTLAVIPAMAAPPKGHGHETELSREMKNIGKNAKALKPILADPLKKDEALQDIGQMIQSAEKAKTLTPEKTPEIPADKRDQFVQDFQKQIDGLITQFKKVQTAIQNGNIAEAQTEFGKIGGMKRDGHEKFASDEHEHGH